MLRFNINKFFFIKPRNLEQELPNDCYPLIEFNGRKYSRYFVDPKAEALYRLCYNGMYKRVRVNYDLKFSMMDDDEEIHNHSWKRFRALYFPEEV